MMAKNLRLKSRDLRTTMIELLSPCALLALLVWGFSLTETVQYEATEYTDRVFDTEAVASALMSSVTIEAPGAGARLSLAALA